MSTTQRPMPDFADALERHLRHAAAEAAAGRLEVSPLPAGVREPTRERARTRPAGRPLRLGRPIAALGSVALVAVLVVALLVAGGSGPGTGRAYGAPLALRTPLVVLPDYARSQTLARDVLGPDGPKITRGHAVPLPDGSTAYLYGNAAGQCLWAPDPLIPDPREGGGVTCTRTSAFLRFGIFLGMGTDTQGTIIAALPQGVRDPVVSRRGEVDRPLTPSTDGVVVLSTISPATVTFFDRDGEQQVVQVATPLGPDSPPVRVNPLRNELPGISLPFAPPEPPVVSSPDYSQIPPPGFPLPSPDDDGLPRGVTVSP
ncbi:hypothetical protein [Patulibacter minatonensis]|uniref:hypothetical protein n=1 Tax=Patulibacter minatonensis TaxID=298163 RepID=UPI0012F75FD4|nr:hypothetical protein [Patulibacter minatonensis]